MKRLTSMILGGLAFAFSGLFSQTLPPGWPTYYPAWWYNSADPSESLIDVSRLGAPQNEAPINQGQLWHLASTALAELNTRLALIGGAGFTLDTFKEPGADPDYYAPATLGQLKFMVSHFYGRFAVIGFGPGEPGWPTTLVLDHGPEDEAPHYPWLRNQTPDNYSPATIGQAKHLFSWDISAFDVLSVDSDSSGLPDWWQHQYFGSTGVDPTADPDGDGLTNVQEFFAGTDPTDYFDGVPVSLQLLAGNGQTVVLGAVFPIDLHWRVTDQLTELPLDAYSVSLSLEEGEATLLNPADNSPFPLGEPLLTDSNGVFYVRVQTGGSYTGPIRVRLEAPSAGTTVFNEANLTVSSATAVTVVAGGFSSLYHEGIASSVRVWGNNETGQLGLGDTLNRWQPTHLPLVGNGLVSFAIGSRHSLGLDETGKLYAWGANDYGQLGLATTFFQTTPQPLMADKTFTAVGVGAFHSVAIDSEGAVWAWGANFSRQLSADPLVIASSEPVMVALPAPVSRIAAGARFTLALLGNGQVRAWGENLSGQLGNGNASLEENAVEVGFPEPAVTIVSLAAGRQHSLALDDQGRVWAWGANDFGQLGTGDRQPRMEPELVPLATDVLAIAAGDYFSAALTSDGKVLGWGNNRKGQMASPPGADELVPVTAFDDAGSAATVLAVGTHHIMTGVSSGEVFAWGGNESGQLGQGHASESEDSPTLVPMDTP